MSTAIAPVISDPKKVRIVPLQSAAPASLPSDGPHVNVLVSRIVPSPWNRRAEVDDDFVENVRKNGVLENVILRPHKATAEDVAQYSVKADPFEAGASIMQLVAGERRWLAAKKCGRSHVPAAVRNLTDVQAMELQIDENEYRQNLSPLQRADAYDNLRRHFMDAHKGEKGYSEESAIKQVAESRKCGPRTVYDVISLKKLVAGARAMLHKEEISVSHAYEIARRSSEDQLTLVNWLFRETQHSQGDVPSVRRLKREIQAMDIAADENRRREKLFKDPQPGTATSSVPTVGEALYLKAVNVVREMHLHRMNDPLFLQRNLKVEPAAASALFARLEKEGIVGPRDSNRERSYIFPKTTETDKLIHRLHTNTLTPEDEKKLKPPTAAQLKKEAAAQDKFERDATIEKKYQALFFAALAKKAQINSRFLTHVIPGLFTEASDLPIPFDDFAQSVLGWPAPQKSRGYDVAELSAHARKHTRKYTPGLLAALVISLHVNEPQAEQLAKYFGVDCKRLRKQAADSMPKKGKA